MADQTLTMYLKAYDMGMEAALKRVSAVTGQFEQNTNKTGASAGRMGIAFGAASALIQKGMSLVSSSVGSAVARLDTLNNYPKVMEALGYSTKDADKSIKKLSDGIEGLPTSLDSIVRSSQTLTATLGNLDKASDTAVALNDMFLAGGQGAEAASRALVQYNQMLAKGKVDMQSWNSVVEVAPGQLKQLAETLLGAGKNQKDLYAALQSGKISMTEFNDAVIKLDKEGGKGFASFADQAKNATGGIATSFQNVKTAIVKGVANTIDVVNNYMSKIGLGTIQGVFDKAKQVVNNAFVTIQNVIKQVLNAISPYIKSLIKYWQDVAKNIKTLVIPAFNVFISILSPVAKVLSTITDSARKMLPIITAIAVAYKTYTGALKIANSEAVKHIKSLYETIAINAMYLKDAAKELIATKSLTAAKEKLNGVMKLGIDPVSATIAAIAGLVTIVTLATSKQRELAKAYQEANTEAKNFAKENANSEAVYERQSEKANEYLATIERLNSKEKLNKQEKDLMASTVQKLNALTEDTVATIDKSTGKTMENTNAIKQSVKAIIEKATQEARYQKLVEATKKQIEAETKLEKARADAMKSSGFDKQKDFEKYVADYQKQMDKYGKFNNKGGAVSTEVANYLKQANTLKTLNGEVDRYTNLLGGATNAEKAHKGSVDSATQSLNNESTASEKAAQRAQELKEKIIDATTGFDAFDGGTEYAAQDLQENMQSMIDGVTGWKNNLLSITSKLRQSGSDDIKGMTESFVTYLTDLGPQSANAIKALNEMSQPELENYVRQWSQTKQIPKQMAQALGLTQQEVETKGSAITTTSKTKATEAGQGYIAAFQNQGWNFMWNPFIEANKGAETSSKNTKSNIKSNLDMKEDLSKAGKNSGDGFTISFQSALSAATSVAKKIGSGIIGTLKNVLGIHSPSKELAKIGNFAMLGLYNGIQNKGKDVIEEVNDIAKRISTPFDNQFAFAGGYDMSMEVVHTLDDTRDYGTFISNMDDMIDAINDRPVIVDANIEMDKVQVGKMTASTVRSENDAAIKFEQMRQGIK